MKIGFYFDDFKNKDQILNLHGLYLNKLDKTWSF